MGFRNKTQPFSFLGKKGSSGGGLVTGADGNLVVLNGQTYQLTAGNIYNFNSIDVQAGGVLEITGTETIPTQLGCLNSFIVNGTFRGYTDDDPTTRTLSSDSWLSGLYSHTQIQNAGGAGSRANALSDNSLYPSCTIGTGYGGAQWNGNGGGGGGNASANGGAGGANGGSGWWFDVATNAATCSFSGDILTCVSGGVAGANGNFWDRNGGLGVFSAGQFGQNAASYYVSNGFAGGGAGGYPAGGGGGGYIMNYINDTKIGIGYAPISPSGAGGGGRGWHGRNCFILAEQGIQGSGTIDFGGGNGGHGGGYANWIQRTYIRTAWRTIYDGAPPSPTSGSGGGGGGAGGAGGALWIRHFGASVTPTINVGGGSGGQPSPIGDGGNVVGSLIGYSHTHGGAGAGSNGNAGVLDVQSI